MKPFSQIKADAQKIVAIGASIKTAAAAESAAIAKIKGDTSRSAVWQQTEIATIHRDSKVDELLRELRERFNELKPLQELWTSPFYALSRERILEGPVDATMEANEATVRANFRAELALMPTLAAQLLVAEAAANRDWGRVFQGVLVLGTEGVPFGLDELPIPAVDAGQQMFFDAEVAFRLAGIDAEGLKGTVSSSSSIGLGLLRQEHDRKRIARQRGWTLNLDERKKLGFDKAITLQDKLSPKPLEIVVEQRETGANYYSGARFEAVSPGEIPE